MRYHVLMEVAKSMTRKTKFQIGLGLLIVILIIWTLIWIRLPRSFAFVSKFQGVEIPYPEKQDKYGDLYKRAKLESTSFGFRVNPALVKDAMREELEARGWTYDDSMEIFLRADFQDAKHVGVPVQTFSNVVDSAYFESDVSRLNVPTGTTCIAVFTKMSNFGELIRSLREQSVARP